MSVKFEVADWQFELTLKEMICRPIESKTQKVKRNHLASGHKRTENNNTLKREKRHEFNFATRRQIG